MKVLFLTWGERVSETGLYRSQVINLCAEISKAGVSIELCSFVPILNRDMVKQKHQYFSGLEKCDKLASQNDITFCSNHYLGSSFEIYTPWLLWPIVHAPWNLSRLKTIIKDGQYDVIHCRSYHAAFAALKAMNKMGKTLPLVFDPRGLMPEEGVLQGRFLSEGISYSRWKKVEQYILQHASVTIAVSSTMKTHYEKLGAHDVRLVYISSDVGMKELPVNVDGVVSSNKKQLIYVGAIGTWHPAKGVFDVFWDFRKENPDTTLRILAPKHAWGDIYNSATEKGLNPLEFSVGYAKTRLELENEIRASYAGLLTYRTPSNEIETLVASTVLSTKFVEYLTGGIPVIANKYCGGAANYIFSNGCGTVYDPEHIERTSFAFLADFWRESKKRVQVIKKSKHDFSVTNNARRYASLYAELITKQNR